MLNILQIERSRKAHELRSVRKIRSKNINESGGANYNWMWKVLHWPYMGPGFLKAKRYWIKRKFASDDYSLVLAICWTERFASNDMGYIILATYATLGILIVTYIKKMNSWILTCRQLELLSLGNATYLLCESNDIEAFLNSQELFLHFLCTCELIKGFVVSVQISSEKEKFNAC